MAFIDISDKEQARADAQLEKWNQGILGAVKGIGDIQETKRQRALKAYELKRQLEEQAGRPLQETESKSVEDFVQTGQESKGLSGLFSDISRINQEDKKLDRDYKRAQMRSFGARGTENKTFDQIDAMRKEVAGMPATKNLIDMDTSLQKISNAVKNPSAAGDLGLIFSYMKMLDPTSTVREGEAANAQNATGIPEAIANAYNRALKGTRLDNKQREDFFNQALNYAESQLGTYKKAIEPIQTSVKSRGLDPSQIFTNIDFEKYKQQQLPSQSVPQGFDYMSINGGQQIPYAPSQMGVPGINDAMAAPAPQGMITKEGLKGMSRAEKLKLLKGK